MCIEEMGLGGRSLVGCGYAPVNCCEFHGWSDIVSTIVPRLN